MHLVSHAINRRLLESRSRYSLSCGKALEHASCCAGPEEGGCRDPFLPQVRCQHLCLREGRVHEERRWRYCSRYSPSDCTRGNWMDCKDHMGRCRNYSKTMSSRKLFVIRKDCVYRRRDLLAFDVDCDSVFFTKVSRTNFEVRKANDVKA
jgi:hypothetical protein